MKIKFARDSDDYTLCCQKFFFFSCWGSAHTSATKVKVCKLGFRFLVHPKLEEQHNTPRNLLFVSAFSLSFFIFILFSFSIFYLYIFIFLIVMADFIIIIIIIIIFLCIFLIFMHFLHLFRLYSIFSHNFLVFPNKIGYLQNVRIIYSNKKNLIITCILALFILYSQNL